MLALPSALGWWIGGGRKRKPIPNAHLEEIAEPFFSKMYPQSWHQMFRENFENWYQVFFETIKSGSFSRF